MASWNPFLSFQFPELPGPPEAKAATPSAPARAPGGENECLQKLRKLPASFLLNSVPVAKEEKITKFDYGFDAVSNKAWRADPKSQVHVFADSYETSFLLSSCIYIYI